MLGGHIQAAPTVKVTARGKRADGRGGPDGAQRRFPGMASGLTHQ